jgi:nucleoside-triphosphatase
LITLQAGAPGLEAQSSGVMAAKVLITGRPGVGKTTLIKRIVEALPSAAGFYTEEIREGGSRKGFNLVGLSGPKGSVAGLSQGAATALAHVEFKGPHRVGKYGVDVRGFEGFLDELSPGEAGLVVIDEIGKMECLSEKFRILVKEILKSDKTVVATIAQKGTPFIEGLKRMPGVRLLEITEGNRGRLLKEILGLI